MTTDPISLECSWATCKDGAGGTKFKTPAGQLSDVVKLLDIHARGAHGADEERGRSQGSATGRPNRMATPKLEMGTGPDDFALWKDKWKIYKRTSGISSDEDVRCQLVLCCSEELHSDH